jgi:hypothetical protein
VQFPLWRSFGFKFVGLPLGSSHVDEIHRWKPSNLLAAALRECWYCHFLLNQFFSLSLRSAVP